MKNLIILTILLLPALTIQAQDEAFEKLADTKGVEVVYISKSMFGMMSNMEMNMSGFNVGKIAGKLRSITILSGETNEASKIIRAELKRIFKQFKYEQIMYMKDDYSKTVFYSKEGNSKKDDSELLMVSDEEPDISVIRIVGSISANDIQSITNKKTGK